ncbi:MAG TPA: hypothetical protein VG674_06165 [Amycolatopsis sp.]|jgi:hypothetical protein|nr:hypothetical protein [Amycolatopsis sp.]
MKAVGAAAVVIALLGVAGCDSANNATVRDVAQRFIEAPTCALLAPRARDSATCSSLPPLPRAPVGSVSSWGDEAQARTDRDVLFLHEFPSGWLITGAGCRPRNDQVYDCAVGGP